MNFGTLKTSILVMPLPCPRSDVCAHHEHPAHADDGAPGEHANSRAPPPPQDSATECYSCSQRFLELPALALTQHSPCGSAPAPRRWLTLRSRLQRHMSRHLEQRSQTLQLLCLQIRQMGLTGCYNRRNEAENCRSNKRKRCPKKHTS